MSINDHFYFEQKLHENIYHRHVQSILCECFSKKKIRKKKISMKQYLSSKKKFLAPLFKNTLILIFFFKVFLIWKFIFFYEIKRQFCSFHFDDNWINEIFFSFLFLINNGSQLEQNINRNTLLLLNFSYFISFIKTLFTYQGQL